MNAVATPAAATCGGARGALPVDDVAAPAAALDGDPPIRVAVRAASRVVAASALGDAAGGDGVARRPAGLLRPPRARRFRWCWGARFGRRFALIAVGPAPRSPLLSGDGLGGLRGAAPVVSLDDDDSTRGAADAAALRGSDFAYMPRLRRDDLLSKTVYDGAQGRIPRLERLRRPSTRCLWRTRLRATPRVFW